MKKQILPHNWIIENKEDKINKGEHRSENAKINNI